MQVAAQYKLHTEHKLNAEAREDSPAALTTVELGCFIWACWSSQLIRFCWRTLLCHLGKHVLRICLSPMSIPTDLGTLFNAGTIIEPVGLEPNGLKP